MDLISGEYCGLQPDLAGRGGGAGRVRVRGRGAVLLPQPARPQLPHLGARAGMETYEL